MGHHVPWFYAYDATTICYMLQDRNLRVFLNNTSHLMINHQLHLIRPLSIKRGLGGGGFCSLKPTPVFLATEVSQSRKHRQKGGRPNRKQDFTWQLFAMLRVFRGFPPSRQRTGLRSRTIFWNEVFLWTMKCEGKWQVTCISSQQVL